MGSFLEELLALCNTGCLRKTCKAEVNVCNTSLKSNNGATEVFINILGVLEVIIKNSIKNNFGHFKACVCKN